MLEGTTDRQHQPRCTTTCDDRHIVRATMSDGRLCPIRNHHTVCCTTNDVCTYISQFNGSRLECSQDIYYWFYLCLKHRHGTLNNVHEQPKVAIFPLNDERPHARSIQCSRLLHLPDSIATLARLFPRPIKHVRSMIGKCLVQHIPEAATADQATEE
ncbi:hypothetical protein TNCV_2982651 [Trichonephila clavipes]|nr:hypothetical protein TNCV_2982651 [Trichonephila clavipes]